MPGVKLGRARGAGSGTAAAGGGEGGRMLARAVATDVASAAIEAAWLAVSLDMAASNFSWEMKPPGDPPFPRSETLVGEVGREGGGSGGCLIERWSLSEGWGPRRSRGDGGDWGDGAAGGGGGL